MAPVYAEYAIKAYLDAAWEDLTASVIGRIFCSWGIPGNGPIDFLAATGTLRFTLKNADGAYSPNGASPISTDWKKGAPVKIEFTYDGRTRTWYGAIDDFDFDASGPRTRGKVTVTVVDWMNRAANYPLNYPDIQLEQTADEIVQTIIDAMPIAPLETDFAVGVNTFPVVFDTVTDFTKAYTEFGKVLLSELCYLYVRHGGALGESLVLENVSTRASAEIKTIPILNDGFLLLETGDYLLLETGDKLILDAVEEFESDNDALSYETSYGDNVINDVMFRYIPKVYLTIIDGWELYGTAYAGPVGWNDDGADGDITFLESIPAGETKTILSNWGNFADENGYNTIGGAEMAALIASWGSSRYFEASSGDPRRFLVSPPYPSAIYANNAMRSAKWAVDGTDISADLVVVSLSVWMDRIEIVLRNDGAVLGYLNPRLFPVVGSSLIVCDPEVQVQIQDTGSIAENDHQPLQFDQVYQIGADAGTDFANNVLATEAEPRTVLNRINFCANRSAHFMEAFMNLDIGDKFHATDTNKGIDADFFLQDFKFTVDPGGLIMYSLGVKEYTAPPLELISVGTQTGTSVASINWSHTIATGAYRLLVVCVATRGSDTVSGVTFGAQSLTLFDAYEQGNTNSDSRVEIWYLVAPAVGTDTVTITTSAGSYLEAMSVNFVGADPTSPFGVFVHNDGTSTAPTVTAAGEEGDLILDILSTWTTATVGAGQTQRFNATSDGSWRGAGSTEPGAASVIMSWTLGSSQKWAIGAVAIKKAR